MDVAGPVCSETYQKWKNREELTFCDLKILLPAFCKLVPTSEIPGDENLYKSICILFCQIETPPSIFRRGYLPPIKEVADYLLTYPETPYKYSLPMSEVIIPKKSHRFRTSYDLIVGFIWTGKKPIKVCINTPVDVLDIPVGTTITFPERVWFPASINYTSEEEGVLKCLMVLLPMYMRSAILEDKYAAYELPF